MSTWNTLTVGSWNQVFNAANQPTAPAFAAGDWLFIFIYQLFGTNTMSVPAGWTDISPHINGSTGMYLFAFRSVTGAEAMPSMTLGTSWSDAVVIKVSGGPTTVTGIVNNSNDRYTISTQNFNFPSSPLTVSLGGCLVLACGARNKTSTSDAATIGNFGGTGNGFSAPVSTNWPPGTRAGGVINAWIQTTATTIASGGNSTSIADSATQSTRALIVALNAGSAASGSPLLFSDALSGGF